MRLVKVGNKNWAVTEGVAKVASAWNCKPVEGGFLCVIFSQTKKKLRGVRLICSILLVIRHAFLSTDTKRD